MKSGYNFKKWNTETDILVIDEKPLLQDTHPVVIDNSPWTYSINTAEGFYHKTKNKAYLEDDLLLTNENGTKEIFNKITVWPHKYFAKFMIVTIHDTKQTIVIDSRGIPFEINCTYSDYCYGRDVYNDRSKGIFVIDKTIIIKYRSSEQQGQYEEKSAAITGVIFNKEFNKFVRSNAKDNRPYLYLTGGTSKCGLFLDYFIETGMEYEIVPNMLCDDESVNVRVPLYGQNILREDVQYLCAKYSNTYAIYNIPINIAGGIFTPQFKLYTSVPDDKECLARSIFNTFCEVFGTNDKNKIFQKTTAKVLRLFNRASNNDATNQFLDILKPHPNEMCFNDDHYIYECTTFEELHLEFEKRNKIVEQYRKEYEQSKQLFKERMQQYETNIQQALILNGKKLSRWKNESHLYAMVSKVYPDAIYQYHNTWLGLQSLDIFIPSLSIGIEYQGEQHYRPIDFFGGEESFNETVKRDKRKAKLCNENNVKLIYWRYDETISISRLNKKIRETL